MQLGNIAVMAVSIGMVGWATVAPISSNAPSARPSARGQVVREPALTAQEVTKPPKWATVSPILSRNCASCHGETKAAGIDLRTYESTMASKTVVKGRPDKSKLVSSVKAPKGKRPTMPPGRPPLSPKLVKQIEDWVKGGAQR